MSRNNPTFIHQKVSPKIFECDVENITETVDSKTKETRVFREVTKIRIVEAIQMHSTVLFVFSNGIKVRVAR